VKNRLLSHPAFAARLLLVFVFQATVALASQLSDDVAQYRQKTTAALRAETTPKAKTYLERSLALADLLDGLEPGSPRLSPALAEVGKRHQQIDEILTPDEVPSTNPSEPRRTKSSVTPQVEAENQAYNTHLNRYVRAEYVVKTKLQADLLSRKYFNTETAKNANYIEGWINSRWALTRADDSRIDDETLGVKPWEAIFRFEPTLALRNGPQAAVMGTLGLTYTYFPMIDRSASPLAFKQPESFASGTLKKTGVRLGAGAGRIDGKTRLLVGPGVQVSAFAFWGLYEPHDRVWMLGISTADLSKLKKTLGWF
jgi:hypothetical protein